ncbi:MAG: hypothetical protein P1V81_15780 [Planctomycetota bacterium]|nr:hypothetical protein [Planctomycetota bacterium]
MSTTDDPLEGSARDSLVLGGEAGDRAPLPAEAGWDRGERPAFLFRLAAHAAGLLGMLGIGWACATGFLVADLALDLGMNTDEGDPILPFMLWLALPLVVLSLVTIGVALNSSTRWARHRPYSAMLGANYLFLALALLVAILAWPSA